MQLPTDRAGVIKDGVRGLDGDQNSLQDTKNRKGTVECTPVQLQVRHGMAWSDMVQYVTVWYVMCTVWYVMCSAWYVISYTPYHTLSLLVEYNMACHKLSSDAR